MKRRNRQQDKNEDNMYEVAKQEGRKDRKRRENGKRKKIDLAIPK